MVKQAVIVILSSFLLSFFGFWYLWGADPQAYSVDLERRLSVIADATSRLQLMDADAVQALIENIDEDRHMRTPWRYRKERALIIKGLDEVESALADYRKGSKPADLDEHLKLANELIGQAITQL